MLYTQPLESYSADAIPPETFPDNKYFAYFCPTPRTFPLFVCGHYPPGIVAPPHNHPYLALHGCMDGPLVLQTELGNLHLNEGDFYLLPPGMRHNWHNPGSYTGSVIALLIDTNSPVSWPALSGVDACLHDLGRIVNRLHRFSATGDAQLQQCFWRAADHLTAEEELEPMMTTGVLLSLLGQIHERLIQSPRLTPQSTNIAREIYRILQRNVENRLDIPKISALVGVSPTRAKQAFQEEYGCGIIKYFNHLKMVQAKRLLCDPSLTIEQVSYRLSFASPCYFSRAFAQHTGQCPSSFRSSIDHH